MKKSINIALNLKSTELLDCIDVYKFVGFLKQKKRSFRL